MKKHLIWAAASAALLASCAKEETQTFTPAATDLPQASITFVAEENADFTRAFFDNTTTTEAWEQSLSSLTVFCFEEGALVMRRNFTSAELSSRRSTFALPRSTAGKSIEFYALANAAVDENITTKTALLALTEETPGSYNGTFANVSSKALRSGGFLMSGTATKSIGAAGTTTEVAITLRRDVAKVAVQASLSPAFADKYPGTVRITSVKLSRSAMQTPYFGGTPKTGAMTFTHTQTPGETSGRFNALFYCFENAALASGSRVLLTLDGVYDRDGKTSTTTDQVPISYEVELSGTAGNGQLARNGYYRVAIGLTGLTGQDVTASITVAPWETPVTQNINIGI